MGKLDNEKKIKVDAEEQEAIFASRKKAPKVREKNHNIVGGFAIVLAIIALIGATGSAVLSGLTFWKLTELHDEVAEIAENSSSFDGNSTAMSEGTVAQVAEKIAPSVVSIVTELQTVSMWGQTGTSSASGTGMIVSADGYILTNKHVVEGAKKVKVILYDETTYNDVTVVGTDPLNDVAFLKINGAKDLQPAELGDSKTIKVGQPVVAIGNALGEYQNSITQGVISGVGRSITAGDGYGNSENLTDMIQTDAAINQGNSGGPLVNAGGEVIGMNTAVSQDGNALGFAIPISVVKGMLNNLIATGKVERPYIGVYYLPITAEVIEEFDLSVKNGAYVWREDGEAVTMAGSPAEKAGIKSGDIILKVGDSAVGPSGTVSALISEYKVKDKVKMTILRDGKEIILEMTLDSFPKQ